MSLTVPHQKLVVDFLCDAFSPEEFSGEFYLQFGQWSHYLPCPPYTPRGYFITTVQTLDRYGLINSVFFDWLIEQRPQRSEGIKMLQAVHKALSGEVYLRLTGIDADKIAPSQIAEFQTLARLQFEEPDLVLQRIVPATSVWLHFRGTPEAIATLVRHRSAGRLTTFAGFPVRELRQPAEDAPESDQHPWRGMLPAALTGQLRQGIADFLRASFWSNTPGFTTLIEDLIATPGGITKGPYLSVKLPFASGSRPDFFPDVPLRFPPHAHQELAFTRLSQGRSALVATGTGSGKTESFLLPILAHCADHAGTPGIKAILIYPMNALATDQALRLAKTIHRNDKLRDTITAGLYVGEDSEGGKHAHQTMGPDHLITDRQTMRLSPPDILLTNYKMLDYMLVRPEDRELWTDGQGLTFLVVDELHTFDGAQGTDLACLIRRLKDRLAIPHGMLRCVGTSATLGGDASGKLLRGYARDIFGQSFEEDAIITEQRLHRSDFLASPQHHRTPTTDDTGHLSPERFTSPRDYLTAQLPLWFDGPIAGQLGTDAWRVNLGESLRSHAMLARVLDQLEGAPLSIDDLTDRLARVGSDFDTHPGFGRLVLTSLLSLLSAARSWQVELPAVRSAREQSGRPRPTVPFLQVQVQLWQRELRRMVASVGPAPRLTFHDDLTPDERKQHLPVVHCRDCGAMGWATLRPRDRAHQIHCGLQSLYRGFFSRDPRVHFFFPLVAAEESWERVVPQMLDLDTMSLTTLEDTPEAAGFMPIAFSESHRTVDGRLVLHKDCPFCSAPAALSLVGFQAATLTSVYIDQLFASGFNDDKKLLTFSDSVQDAAHRAGFFGARTWSFNLRVALNHVLTGSTRAETLATLPDTFERYWRGQLDDTTYVSTFLAPNMVWLQEYEEMQATEALPPGSPLPGYIKRRITWEIAAEFGQRSRIGRSLPRTRSAVASVPLEAITPHIPRIAAVLREEIGGLRELTDRAAGHFLAGLLLHLTERGAILHPELPKDYIATGGKNTWLFRKRIWLPGVGPASRLPALLTDQKGTRRFDAIASSTTGRHTWYQSWYGRCFDDLGPLIGEVDAALKVVLPLLSDLLQRTDMTPTGAAWGIPHDQLRITTSITTLRCESCLRATPVPADEVAFWRDLPCLQPGCRGTHTPIADSTPAYFASLYASGDVARIFAEEHTGLLTRSAREDVEHRFKAEGDARRPWFPNLLSCTPTLEMGIDIGDLSTTILCSMPPAQANYLQRIGRAGRRDGNALVLTVANARSHDLYFYAEPEEMLAGTVTPPGVYLDAGAVLERQLTAYCFDRWVAQEARPGDLPHTLKQVFEQLSDPARFPQTLFRFITARQSELLHGFLMMFVGQITSDTEAQLTTYIAGNQDTEGALPYRISNALHAQMKFRDSLQRDLGRLSTRIRNKKKEAVQTDLTRKELEELIQERSALRTLKKDLEKRQTLNFFTDEGLMPNYAFPQAGVRLRSVIWRKKKDPTDGKAYESWSYEYGRPAGSALEELAPDNRFYASGRQVQIDRVDVSTTEIEIWRFCDSCSHMARDSMEHLASQCPQCGSEGWPDPGQKHKLLKLRQVFARTSDRDSRLRDERDERQPRRYNRQMLVQVTNANAEEAWKLRDDALPFAFEYLRSASFTELNFGELTDQGSKITVNGREAVRKGFTICKHCGQLQKDDEDPAHTISCISRDKTNPDDFTECIYLYRHFNSEAVRFLLPITDFATDEQHSSMAAALQLGLREHFRGQVDHIRTAIATDPEKDSHLRRHFLLLLDTVPGGTGYLKQLRQDPDTLKSVLQHALDRMVDCACNADPTRDGCYRCIYAYRNSRDHADISRNTATSLLTRILGSWDLVSIKSLNDVSVNGLMDSVLEARFIEALRRADTSARPCTVVKRLVKGKPGFRLTIGDQVWHIEPQVNVSAPDNLGTPTSIDFVLHPAHAPGRKPIAVFLDGWAFHRKRISHDALQRMSLLTAGQYVVWSFSWHDIAEALREPFERPTELLYADRVKVSSVLKNPRFQPLAPLHVLDRRLDLTAFTWLLDTLSGKATPASWNQLAFMTLFSQLAPLKAADAARWDPLLEELAPDEAHNVLERTGTDLSLIRQEGLLTLMVRGEKQAIFEDLKAHLKPGATSSLQVLAVLDDTDLEHPALRRTWNGFLRLLNFLQFLPHIWFVSRTRTDPDYLRLAQHRETQASPHQAPWSAVLDDIDEAFHELAGRLQAAGLPLPEVGIELPDARDEPSGAEGELVWPARKVAVVRDGEPDFIDSPLADGWRLFELSSLVVDDQPLLDCFSSLSQS